MRVREFVTTKTAAKEVDKSPRTIRQYCKSGIIKAKKWGRDYMIERQEWEEWKARKIVEAC